MLLAVNPNTDIPKADWNGSTAPEPKKREFILKYNSMSKIVQKYNECNSLELMKKKIFFFKGK